MGSVDTAAAALWAAQSGSPEVGDWNGAGLSLARKLSAAVHARAEGTLTLPGSTQGRGTIRPSVLQKETSSQAIFSGQVLLS